MKKWRTIFLAARKYRARIERRKKKNSSVEKKHNFCAAAPVAGIGIYIYIQFFHALNYFLCLFASFIFNTKFGIYIFSVFVKTLLVAMGAKWLLLFFLSRPVKCGSASDEGWKRLLKQSKSEWREKKTRRITEIMLVYLVELLINVCWWEAHLMLALLHVPNVGVWWNLFKIEINSE